MQTAATEEAPTSVGSIGSVRFTNLNAESPLAWSGDLFVIGMFSDAEYFPGEKFTQLKGLQALNIHFDDALVEIMKDIEFEGKIGQSGVIRVSGGQVKKLAVIGLGSSADLTLDSWRNFGSSVAEIIKQNKSVKTVGLYLPVGTRSFSGPNSVQGLVEGIRLGLWDDVRFKSEEERKKKKAPQIQSIDLLGWGISDDTSIEKAAKIIDGVNLARALVNAPASTVTPVTLAATAEEISSETGLECTILEKEHCEDLNMGLFLGVAKGSSIPPKFIHLTYRPAGEVTRKVAIVGKGLCFDSGGYNLKVGPGSMIENMKIDMAGAAATLGTAKVIGELKPPLVEVHFIIATCENMISGEAMRPGDVLVGSNGTTVEVANTDAEGRLTLGDALVYAEKLGVDTIVDCATLTGAALVALGGEIAALYSTKDDLAGELEVAAKLAGEKIWRMPLEEKYAEMNKSSIADIKNTGGRMGGSITAALFLKHFVKSTPWAHIDMAGPVFNEKAGGATGYGVRTLVNFLLGKDATIDG
eukprot:CAMPEP_0196655986 /NCGR_PEP_ID=MMETSP1086-20130531/11829_1 /TAXON_ID=77921 /ORGANISM="Cyanoptyche  gloeocystis , Strain SAG4.97" /LENGTH=526 /DNA_ID=CAMNT_0041988555 /DNA_START=263 /DNA_END=1843 /DNA_ORIENTATION=+